MPTRYVHVYPLGDGRWTWRMVTPDSGLENGPAYPLRAKAAKAVAELFPHVDVDLDPE